MPRTTRRRYARRRASAYALVLMTSLMVAVVGVSALTAVRVEARAGGEVDSLGAARIIAKSGIELATQMMHDDPLWRTTLGDGAWKSNARLGAGSLTIEAADPVDNSVATGNDPVVITATGRVGNARHRSRATIDVTGGYTALDVAVHAGGQLSVSNATLATDQAASANAGVAATSANVYGAVHSATTIAGATFHGATRPNQTARTLPLPADVVSTYVAAGTAIAHASLAGPSDDRVQNGGFESNTAGWSATDVTTILSRAAVAYAGSYSLSVATRLTASAGAQQDVTAQMLSGHSYILEAAVRRQLTTITDFVLTLEVVSEPTPGGGLMTVRYSTPATIVGSTWVKLTLTPTVSWSGRLVSARIVADTKTSLASFYLDAVSLKYTDLPATGRTMIGKLLSPTANPYGTTNASGVYVIDCANQDVHVRDSRIVGTLVLLDPGAGSTIASSVNWQAAAGNYPALVVRGNLTISLSSSLLSEGAIGNNLNPTGTPYSGVTPTTNSTMWDTYPSTVQGLLYATGNLTFSGTNTLVGLITAGGNVSVTGGSTQLSFRNTYSNTPPPGFDAIARTITLRRGSFTPVTD